MTAVAVGAVSVAVQHLAAASTAHPVDPLALSLDENAAAARTGMGGPNPRPPEALPLPEVLPVVSETAAQDLSALRKGQQVADQRAAQARAEAARQAQAGVPAPVTGTITSNFGPRWGSVHQGLDIANALGTPIVSATDGIVIDAGPASGFGLWVRIRNDEGVITTYGHLNQTLVEVGEQVSVGEQIATVGNRGNSTGPHLHFEVTRNDTQTNPLEWLRDNGADI